MTLLIITLWLVVGYINSGFIYGYFRYKYPAFNHNFVRWLYLPFGPLGIPSTLFVTECGLGHWSWKASTREERWQEHQRLWPNLDYNYFLERD